MNEIDLRHFDLNLLVVFDVLMTERSVTRAAERLGAHPIGCQPFAVAATRAIRRSPAQQGRGADEPTALALDLIEQARPMLGGIQRVLSPQHVFDPGRRPACSGSPRPISCWRCSRS